ncbi:MAG: hypothetical protein H0V19_00390, partial [Euzebyales bacterium]|nr:hypothetical protein [Euzebyales bacterium]
MGSHQGWEAGGDGPRLWRIAAALATVVLLALAGGRLLGPATTPDSGLTVNTGESQPPPAPRPTPASQPAVSRPPMGSWRQMAPAPIGPRAGHVAVWTGDQLVVWGGREVTGRRLPRGDGAAYNPGTDRWRRLPPAPIGPRA